VELTDEQGAGVGPWMPAPSQRADGRGRPWRENRAVLDGIRWILKTGARGQDLPDRYPPDQTCPRRFQPWVRAGILERLLHAMAEEVRGRGGRDLSECFIDGTVVLAKQGAAGWEPPSGARGARSWPWQPARVFLSPAPWPRRRHMQSRSSTRRGRPASFVRCPDD
jgi:transposase